MSWFVALPVVVLLLGGSLFSLAAAVGINRFPDLYTRMHAASKAGTVGSGLLLLAVGINSLEVSILARSLAAFCFVVLTAPVSAHLLAKAAYQMGYRLSATTDIDEFKADRKLN
ncbi:monovalent cation/H(+) antiporter subunit G [Agrobacterium bohemicum]|uniref:Cation:proton antiporter n=1 Tax=Agrobacterium bohemicum TaxID=2052828 RepID=A0A135P9I6_9HYPH|nr:monovalent cation/H(+) antiporter subunit G [Agrobacterium bohemicum]KXG88063.1 cation:proton antiporter [Agrobacterium bohemicum]